MVSVHDRTTRRRVAFVDGRIGANDHPAPPATPRLVRPIGRAGVSPATAATTVVGSAGSSGPLAEDVDLPSDLGPGDLLAVSGGAGLHVPARAGHDPGHRQVVAVARAARARTRG
ncbi:MAG: hypothetical protein L0K86_10275 [Actinomycetia bacterium]|nr:hypothetical protein [Actinomycetes bacterium]